MASLPGLQPAEGKDRAPGHNSCPAHMPLGAATVSSNLSQSPGETCWPSCSVWSLTVLKHCFQRNHCQQDEVQSSWREGPSSHSSLDPCCSAGTSLAFPSSLPERVLGGTPQKEAFTEHSHTGHLSPAVPSMTLSMSCFPWARCPGLLSEGSAQSTPSFPEGRLAWGSLLDVPQLHRGGLYRQKLVLLTHLQPPTDASSPGPQPRLAFPNPSVPETPTGPQGLPPGWSPKGEGVTGKMETHRA